MNKRFCSDTLIQLMSSRPLLILLLCFQAHYILDEMLMNGAIVETNKQNVLAPIQLLEKAT